MKKYILVIGAIAVMNVCANANNNGTNVNLIKPIIPISNFNPELYAGTWFEIARLPFRIENNCFSNINFNYTWQQNGYKVVQRCNYENGEISVSTGDLQFSSNPTIADFKLSYLPFLFSWLPFAKTEYIILYTDYSNYAIIGSSDLNNLWLLSRKQDNSSAEIQKLIDIVKQYNYPLQKLIFSNLAFNLK